MEKPEQWQKIKLVFGEALERPAPERTSFLDEACGEDTSLRAEVDSLLAAHEESDALSEHPSVGGFGDIGEAPRMIGSYRLLKKIGEGGMGQVWLAEQREPVRRQVALKLLAPGVYNPAGIQRFQSERQALAMMEHPFIAKVLDGGSTADGRPYFVMEFVPGQPITVYCDQHRLDLNSRLELFLQVCEGVQHAHRKAIIHRDLKPSNILVTEVDGKAVPRIIDFGIAKAVSAGPGEERTIFTQAGALVGTPGYMSPEQIDLAGKDIDTRTDVYSLGVVLYVLLTGYMPFTSPQWQKKPIDEILRQIREEDPQSPSTRVAVSEGTTIKAAEARRTEPGQLAASLRGDLDWITLKALEKDRERRYDSPAALAADISCYLENKPILARPASASYRVRKYVQRHRAGVGVAAGALALLIAFVVTQAVQVRRITRERDRADRIAQFMTDIFKVADPEHKLGNAVTARDVLDKAAQDIDTGLAYDPELQAHLLYVMAMAYNNLGDFSHAQSLLERSVQLFTSTLGPDNLQTLRSRQRVAWTLFQQGRLAEAEAQQRNLIEEERRVFGPNHEETIGTMGDLATTLSDERHLPEAEKIQREVLEIQKRVLGPEAGYTLASMDNLAVILLYEGRAEEAEKMERETLEIQRRVYGPENLTTIHYMMNEAEIKGTMGAFDEAEKMSLNLLNLERRVIGPNSPEAAETTYSLGTMKAKQGKTDEALELLREAVDHGMLPREAITLGEDPELNALHGDPRFDALVAHAKEVAASKQGK